MTTGPETEGRHGAPPSDRRSQAADGRAYAHALDAIDEAVLVIDVGPGPACRCRSINAAWRRLTGHTDRALCQPTLAETFGPEQAARIQARLADAIEQGRSIRRVETLDLPAGRLHLDTTVAPFVDPGTRSGHAVVVARDVTRRYAEREQVSRIFEAFAALLVQAPVVLIAVDSNGLCTLCEGRAVSLLALPPGECVGKPMAELVGHHPKIVRALLSALEGRTTSTLLRIPQATFDLRALPLQTPAGIHAFCVGVEMTALFEAQDELQRKHERLSRAQRAARIATWEWDVGTRRIDWSDEIFELFSVAPGRSAEPLTDLLDRVPPEDLARLRLAVHRAVSHRGPLSMDCRLGLPDGGERMFHLEARAECNGHGATVRLAGTVQDVTTWRLLESHTQRSQKLELVGRLAAGVAHDFNNILAVARSSAYLIQSALHAGDPALEFVESVIGATRRGEALTRQLLAVSRQEGLQPMPVALDEAVAKVTPMIAGVLPDHVRIETRAPSRSVRAVIDAGQLEQVLLNLVFNARDAMPSGGVITITTRVEQLAEVQAAAGGVVGGDFAVVSVADTGHGIAPEVLPRIFEPFFTTKARGMGTGLGLAMIMDIARAAGGFARASSSGAGATVEVLLPVAPDGAVLR
jgi:signal transduction histidine kinase